MGSLSRGWSMARASFAVVRRYPKIAILPVISGAAWLLVLGLLVLSLLPLSGLLYGLTAPLWDKLGSDRAGHIAFYVAAAVVLYALTVVTVFFNVALISCALRCHAGQEPSIRAGLAAAKSCLPQILGWALVAATVGLALNAVEGLLQDKLGIVGDLIGGLFGFAWSLATYFVLPVLVVEKVGPITAIRRSSAILRSKWGESLAGETSLRSSGLSLCLAGRRRLLRRIGNPIILRQRRDGRPRRPFDGARRAVWARHSGHLPGAKHDLSDRRLRLCSDRSNSIHTGRRAGRGLLPIQEINSAQQAASITYESFVLFPFPRNVG